MRYLVSIIIGDYSVTYFYFLMWTIFNVFIKFITILTLLFMFWFFGHEAFWILAPRPGMQPIPAALEGGVLTLDHQGSPWLLRP